MNQIILKLCLLLLTYGWSNSMLLAQSKNVIFILVDDQGWNGTSHRMDATAANSKSDYYITPSVEQLATEGVTFSQAYSPGAKCSPSRNSILLGRSPAKTLFTNTAGAVDSSRYLLEPSSSTTINPNRRTFVEVVKQENANYLTGHYGKWHLGTGGPAVHGFDRGDGNTSNSDGDSGGGIQTDPKKINTITDSAIAFIQDARATNRPFYLQLSHYAVHSPIELSQATNTLYNTPGARPVGTIHDNLTYGAMTEDLDLSVGRLLDSLANWGLDTNTYVVYMSDNGGASGFSSNSPLKNGKTFLSEGGIRVPLIIRGPQVVANSYNNDPVVGYDLYRTFIEWMVGTANISSSVEGVSLANILTNTNTPLNRAEALFFHRPHYDLSAINLPESAIIRDSFKFRVDYEQGIFELYNLRQDIGETQDLSAVETQLAKQMCIELRDYLKTVGAAMPKLNPNHANAGGGMSPDVDNDGLDDEWEFRELLTVKYDATDDPDGDNLDNATEFANGTDPYVANIGATIENLEEEVTPVTIFPQPATNELFIRSQLEYNRALLYDYTGRVLLRKTKQDVLNVKNLKAGVYFLVLMNNGERVYTQEVVVQ